jgi:RimJ/RimL family protein N-acetyltransferase
MSLSAKCAHFAATCSRRAVHILTTSRLVLRKVGEEDALAIAPLVNNPRIAENTRRIPSPCSLDDVRRWLSELETGEAAAHVFAITFERRLIGVIGLEGDAHAPELGYWLAEPWWGRGLMGEAASRVLEFAFVTCGYERIIAGYRHGNEASRRILVGLGFRHIGHERVYSVARKGMMETAALEITRREWSALNR